MFAKVGEASVHHVILLRAQKIRHQAVIPLLDDRFVASDGFFCMDMTDELIAVQLVGEQRQHGAYVPSSVGSRLYDAVKVVSAENGGAFFPAVLRGGNEDVGNGPVAGYPPADVVEQIRIEGVDVQGRMNIMT